jgi:cytochrome c oxidase subunit II
VEAEARVIERLLPAAGSAHAASLDAVLYSVHTHMLLIFVMWLAVFVFALVRFRSGANPDPRRQGVRGMWPAIAIGVVIAGDVVILAVLALPAWKERNLPPPAGARPVEVRVIAEQFAWNIHYPGPDGAFGRTDAGLISATNPVGIDRADPAAKDDIGLLNVLTLPVNRTVVVQLMSRDVVHSFTLNEMRVKQDANPGMTSRVWFTPITTGSWDIACSQLCGLGHYRMRGEYRVVTADGWQKWEADELARLQ